MDMTFDATSRESLQDTCPTFGSGFANELQSPLGQAKRRSNKLVVIEKLSGLEQASYRPMNEHRSQSSSGFRGSSVPRDSSCYSQLSLLFFSGDRV